jgi:hypothetical protein
MHYDYSQARRFVSHGRPLLTGHTQWVGLIDGKIYPDEHSACVAAHECIVRLGGTYSDSPEYLKAQYEENQ